MGEKRDRAVELWRDFLTGGWVLILLAGGSALFGFAASLPVYFVLGAFGLEWSWWIWGGLSILSGAVLLGKSERDRQATRKPSGDPRLED